MNSHLYCPHDFSANTEFRDDLPTLLGNNNKLLTNVPESILINKLKLDGPSLNVFHTSSRAEKKSTVNGTQLKFSSPYERYLAVLPFAEQERLAETARIAEQNKKRKLCPDSVITVRKTFHFHNIHIDISKIENELQIFGDKFSHSFEFILKIITLCCPQKFVIIKKTWLTL